MIDIENMGVLVADDIKSMRSIIKKTLRNLNIGREIYFADNGEDGLRILRERKVDLAIVDWQMPVMNGADMLDAIRNDKLLRDMPVLMITGESERDIVYQVAEIEVDAYLLKPLTPAMLESKIQAVVLKHNNPDEATIFARKARTFEESGKLDLAIECQAKAAESRPHASRLRRNLGLLYGKKGMADQMEQCFLEAVASNLQDAVTRNLLSELYWEKKDWGKAVRYECEVLSLTNRYDSHAVKMGTDLLSKKQNSLAVTLLTKLVGKLEKHLPLKESILDLCIEKGEVGFAKRLLQILLKDFPSHHSLLAKAGDLYAHLEDDEKALEYYLAADKNMIDPVESKLKIARLYLKRDKVIQADEIISQVLRIDPANKEAMALRQAI